MPSRYSTQPKPFNRLSYGFEGIAPARCGQRITTYEASCTVLRTAFCANKFRTYVGHSMPHAHPKLTCFTQYLKNFGNLRPPNVQMQTIFISLRRVTVILSEEAEKNFTEGKSRKALKSEYLTTLQRSRLRNNEIKLLNETKRKYATTFSSAQRILSK